MIPPAAGTDTPGELRPSVGAGGGHSVVKGVVHIYDGGDGFAEVRWAGGAPLRRGPDPAFDAFVNFCRRHGTTFRPHRKVSDVELDTIAHLVHALRGDGYLVELDQVVKDAVAFFDAETARLSAFHRVPGGPS